jgi:hypothetical protein
VPEQARHQQIVGVPVIASLNAWRLAAPRG